MNRRTKLQRGQLNDEFLNNFIECCLVKPKIEISSHNTQIGHAIWKSGYKYALRKYITQYVEVLNELPSGVHHVESPFSSGGSQKLVPNIIKFPNIHPNIVIKRGKAILVNKYPHKSDSGCFGKRGQEWGEAPTKYRSLRWLRQDLHWPIWAPVRKLYQFQQHTKLSDDALLYLCRLALGFIKVHQFPPNLVILRDLIRKLPKSRRASKEARELLAAINQLDDESRARNVALNVHYVVKQSNLVRYGAPTDSRRRGSDNISLVPDTEKYKAVYEEATQKVISDVYVLDFEHKQQCFHTHLN